MRADIRLLQTKRAGFLDGGYQLLVEHGEGRIWREVQTVKASVSPTEMQPVHLFKTHVHQLFHFYHNS